MVVAGGGACLRTPPVHLLCNLAQYSKTLGEWRMGKEGSRASRSKGREAGKPRPGLWWAVEGARQGGGNTERVSHRFWARQAAAAERGAHSWLAGRPALMSFPHGPEFPARHDHTGKTLPRPPPPQLPPSHRAGKAVGWGKVGEAGERGPLGQAEGPRTPARAAPTGPGTR